MSKSTIALYSGAVDPTWDHPTIAYEAGFSHATRGLSALLGEKRKWKENYSEGYRAGLKWNANEDPMRFTNATNVSTSR